MKLNPIFFVPFWRGKLDLNNTVFNEALEECFQMEKTTSTAIKSNVGGWQSPSLSYPSHPYSSTPSILSILNNIFDNSLPKICKDLETVREYRVSNFWININRKNCYNVMHVHPSADLSGVIYLTEKNTPITFQDFGIFPEWAAKIGSPHINVMRLLPEKGDYYIFPNWIPHGVGVVTEEEVRVSVAFNIEFYD